MKKLATTAFLVCLLNVLIAQVWTQSTGLTSDLSLRFVKLGRYIFVGNDGSGIWKSSDNGVSWTQSCNGLNSITDYSITEFTIYSDSILIAATYDNGVFKSVDSGATWVSITGALPASTSYPAVDVAANDSMIFVNLESDGTYYTKNAGGTWTRAVTGLTSTFTRQLLIVGDTIFAVGQDGVFKSSIETVSWFPANNGLPSTPTSLRKIYHQNDTLYLGTTSNGIYRSLDNGKNWSSINTTATQSQRIIGIAASADSIFIASISKVYATHKNSINWVEIGNLSSGGNMINDLMLVSGTRKIVATGLSGPYYTGTPSPTPPKPTVSQAGGVLTSSSASGNQWYLNGNLISGANSQNYTPTQSGIYTVKVTVGGASSTSNPYNFALSPTNVDTFDALSSVNVYPNPFSEQTTVLFGNTQNNISVKIFDLLGNLIKEIKCNEDKLVITKDGLIPGVYFIQIHDGISTVSAKIVLSN